MKKISMDRPQELPRLILTALAIRLPLIVTVMELPSVRRQPTLTPMAIPQLPTVTAMATQRVQPKVIRIVMVTPLPLIMIATEEALARRVVTLITMEIQLQTIETAMVSPLVHQIATPTHTVIHPHNSVVITAA